MIPRLNVVFRLDRNPSSLLRRGSALFGGLRRRPALSSLLPPSNPRTETIFARVDLLAVKGPTLYDEENFLQDLEHDHKKT